jgi:hypothetical protein
MSLASVTHESRAPLDQIGDWGGGPDDVFCFGAHLSEQAVGGRSIEAAEKHQPAAHDLIGDRSAEETDGRAYARIGRHKDPTDTDLFCQPDRMQRCRAAERDQRARAQILAAFDGMHARCIGHCLLDDFADPERGVLGRKIERRADALCNGLFGAVRVQTKVAARERFRVNATEH